MERRATYRLRHLTACLAAVVLVAAAVPLITTSGAGAATAPVVTVVIDGRGFGHGVGMSQWGAYGWSTQYGKTWQEIVSFYYGGTSLGQVTNSDFVASGVGRMTVQLVSQDGRQTSVVSDTGVVMAQVDPEARQWSSMVAREVPGLVNTYRVWGSLTRACPQSSDPLADPNVWVLVADSVPGPINFSTPTGDDPAATAPRDLVGVCDPSAGVRYYRGIVKAANQSTGNDRTVSDVWLESYVKAVVPRESGASWGDAAGGAGMNSLRAQAVAARSYALAGSARSSVAKTCDTTSCQVYGGAAVRGSVNGSATLLEDPRTNRATDDTAGAVMRTSAGKVANTMFAASNGGRSVSAGLFPAVDDPGDSVAANPNHTWSVTVAASKIMSAWPSIGKLMDITVTQRTGGGAWDGWIDKLTLKGSAKNLSISGDDFRRALGLKSRYLNFTLIRASGGGIVGPALFIGGSIGVSVRSSLNTLLKDSYKVGVSAQSSRCTLPKTSGTCKTNNAMAIINTTAPVPAFVIMEMGYNDNVALFPSTIDAAMTAITARGTTRVVWVNLSERRPNSKGGSVYAPANQALRDALVRWPQLMIIDWNAASSGTEADSWFVKGTAAKPDLVHLTSVGRSRFSLFIRSQLDLLNAQGMLPNGSPGPGDPGLPILQRGSFGDYVVQLQSALNGRGYVLDADGDFGPSTESKVKAFQAASGLPADGIVAASTWSALGFGPPVTTTTTTTTTSPPSTSPPIARPTLRRGSKGPSVLLLQQTLKARGYNVVADGMFGSRTRAAVISFQKKVKLPQTGVVATKTWRALGL